MGSMFLPEIDTVPRPTDYVAATAMPKKIRPDIQTRARTQFKWGSESDSGPGIAVEHGEIATRTIVASGYAAFCRLSEGLMEEFPGLFHRSEVAVGDDDPSSGERRP
ncbi:MAG TPA: hypothetical protein VH328_01215 [Burkholderiaceae bacterium]|nr:hypothetical protein [Burkholderiaceae bacterium]